jgi:hypothetical protein
MPTNVNADNNVHPKPPLGSDLLWEVDAIAAELGLTARTAYHMLKTGQLPAKKIAGKWCSSRSALRNHFSSVISEVA